MISPEQQHFISMIRQKSQAGTATLEEYKEAIRLMRGDRLAAATSAAEGKKRVAAAKKAIPDANSLLDELDQM